LWVRAHQAWMTRDARELGERLRKVVTVDPRPLAFWINGARMLAYDVTAWRTEAREASAMVREQQARAALAWLDTGSVRHPGRAALHVEAALVHWRLRGDTLEAAAAMRRAAECEDAPFFAA